jgi:uncharacterized Zn finger protein
MTDPDPTGTAARQQCPRCQAADPKAVILTLAFVYLRCEHCGEVWAIPERRELPRETRRSVT